MSFKNNSSLLVKSSLLAVFADGEWHETALLVKDGNNDTTLRRLRRIFI